MGMSPQQWNHVKDLYEAALECDPAQRADFLHGGSADKVVFEEVQRLFAGSRRRVRVSGHIRELDRFCLSILRYRSAAGHASCRGQQYLVDFHL